MESEWGALLLKLVLDITNSVDQTILAQQEKRGKSIARHSVARHWLPCLSMRAGRHIYAKRLWISFLYRLARASALTAALAARVVYKEMTTGAG